jgi:hypothetical protein
MAGNMKQDVPQEMRELAIKKLTKLEQLAASL